MTKKITLMLRALFALPMLLAWLLPQQAEATHVDDTWKYQVMLNGSNTIRISAPVYDMDGADCWVDNGNLKVTWTDDSGTHTETCFHWRRDGDTDNDNKDIYIHFRTDMGGSIEVTQGNSSNHFTLTKADGDIQRLVYRNNDGKTFNVYAVWRVPYALMGKQLTFKWDVHRDGNSRDAMNVPGLGDVPITMPDAQEIVTPQVTTATLSYSESGKLELPWFIASTNLTKVSYEYTDHDGNAVSKDMPTDANAGTIYLDATVPHDNFRIVVSYKDRDDNEIENVSSQVQDLPVLHAPIGLTATPIGNNRAAVRLTWDILYPGTDDLTETDFFEVQRSLTGEEADFVSIGSVPFMVMSDNQSFDFTDSTLVEAITAEQLKNGGTLDRLTYRIRRAITENWGWEGNNCAAQTSCVVDDIHLLRIATYDAKWEDERAHTVRVSWDYANEHNAVWDNRAKLKLRVMMKNRAGEVVDSMLYDLTTQERQQRYKVVLLSRPCVDYDIKVYVEQGTSPISTWEGLVPYYFAIRTADDWNTFCQKIQEARGQYDVNARLYADISINNSCGDTNYPFRGNFDGNGHTLNVAIINQAIDYEAPFRYAKDYTIKDLTVTGSVSGYFFTSGLVGYSDASAGRRNSIKNCQISATVKSNRNNTGGIIGHGNSANHDIDNCLFNGKLIVVGGNSRYGGAIIGMEDGGTDNCITNCMEAGSYEGFYYINLCFAKQMGYNNIGANTNNWSTHGWGYDANGKSADELLAALGSGWTKAGDAIVPKTTTVADPVTTYPTPTLPTFHHESIGKIDPTLKTTTRQSSVLLVWETDGNPIDFFTVMRRLQGTDDSAWKEVETNIDQLSYEDKSVSPLEDYEYKVRATNDCEGISYTETNVTPGACKHTGLLEGYVRFNDGTGIPNITVEIVPQGGGTKVTAKTDESGYYKADSLSYMGEKSVTYIVTPVSEGGIKLERESYSVTFNNESNHEQVHEFTVTNGLGFSAYVMYDGTSIPVKGAHFVVNGQPIYNAAGKLVETDFEGRADFQVLSGVNNTIQVQMPDHQFVGNGYYKSSDGVVLTDKVAQAYFYDSTLVKLTGRVVGGKDQGSLPLDNNLSHNNLGDNLTMVLTLEGDNTSWLVYDNLNPAQSTRQLTFAHPGGKGHQTVADVQRKRMVVKPDSVTGEYVLMLPPVRWKVQQVYCEGYPTLFQDGQVSEIIDLTECLTPDTVKYEGTFVSVDDISVYQPQEIYNYRYDRIYHSPVEITYRQMGYDTFDYFGDKTYVAMTAGGDKVDVPLVYQNEISGYEDYDNPFELYTHEPTLKATDSSTTNAAYPVDAIFNDNKGKWMAMCPCWVEFKTEYPVSVKQYTLTTIASDAYFNRIPKSWILKGRANETDEWTTISSVVDAQDIVKGNREATPYTYDATDYGFYQYFRFEVTENTGSGVVELYRLSLTCRGKADSNPADDRAPEPIMAGATKYTFGYPVFSLERRYPIEIQVAERYLYNNDARANKEDLVKIGGGQVTIHNGMQNGQQRQTVELDENGRGIYYLAADQTTRLLTGENALKTVTMTLTQDGTTYEAKPLKGYVLNMFAMSGSMDAISVDKPLLIDILRDPPGSASTATLSKGSKLKFNYTVDMKFQAGVKLSFGTGTALDNYSGMVAATTEYGIINSGKSENWIDLGIITSGSGKKAYSYTMNVGEDITTSSSGTMIGADADLYIGVVQNMMVTPMSTIRAIPDNMYRQMLGRTDGSKITVQEDATGMSETITSKYGTLVHIAEGRDANDSVYHLVRDESLGYGPQVKSQFIHSQKHILSELLPKLADEILALIFTGTREEAKRQADATGKVVYWSKVPRDDANFGLDYEKIEPAVSQGITDEVAQKLDIFKSWIEMICVNESEKLCAYDLVANYDVDGGSKVTYNETFESEYSVAQNLNYPFTTADYFGEDGTDRWDRLAKAGAVLLSQPALGTVLKMLGNKLSELTGGKVTGDGTNQTNKVQQNSVELKFAGTAFKFGITPVVEYSSTGTYGTTHNYTRKESFTISMDAKSHLLFDVYRVRTEVTDTTTNSKNFEVFHNDNFDDWLEIVNNHVNSGVNYTDVIYPRSFVYRTRGGATANVWENERRTQVYHPGTILDERTKKISNPKITLDRQSVSGVAIGDPARFKVYLTNESEQPEAATGALTMFTFIQDMESNPKGAKIFIDGAPLTGTGMTVVLYPGKVMEKTMEVYAGEEFDYEGLQIGIASQGDFANTQNYVSFDVHYLHEAGPVLIAQPGDKWVMNTNAQYDDRRGWFLPVTINGFNKHQHNFDHIEFQYKESLRGEDSWTNLCSYYADSTLMAQASGVREMIPENGNITTHFYGEGTVMEKAYDLRAVLYCRNGNSFLTTASPIVSGVKDTRRPQLFGTPEPINGILTQGDNIVFNFSEDIEYNYLNAITNFEVKGEVNNDNVSEAVSLQFSAGSSVESEAQRNFSGKDLTIDLMIRPDETGRDMPLFSHGTNGKKLQLWLTGDHKLKAVIDDQTFVSDTAIVSGGFTQVAVSIEAPSGAVGGAETSGSLTFYNGGKNIGSFTLTEPYNGTGPLIFGRTNEADRAKSQYYEGRMMEARLWYRALDGGQVGTTYGSRRLTGYEMGLVDYYPMNEGSGDYALDKTQGANARLINAAWAMPRGLSLHVDWDDKGIALTQDALNRTAEQDYTLMFWFKTDTEGRGVLLSNGAGSKTEINAANQFNIAFEAEKLMYRSNGFAAEVPGNWSDNQWHHLAMTVNRSYNVANIYLDGKLRTTFASDSLGGISGGHPLIGAARYDELQADGQVATIDTRNWLRGNIDELCLFQQALPLSLVQSYATKSPNGNEAGLLTYLSFDRQERQKDNDIVLVAYPYSKKVYTDEQGNVKYQLDPVTQQPTSTPVRDYVFVGSPDEILPHITDETAAPVIPFEELKNLNFSFVGEGHKLLVGINEQEARINRRNIYVTVRDVEDKNGNAMASPQTVCYYVTNSTLSWLIKQETITAQYGYDGTQLNLLICNNGATSHTYTIENCPKWLTLSAYTNVIAPQEYVTITAHVSKDLNVGSYDEILYLTDEDGISEPFYLNLTVEGEQPDWAWSVSSDLLQYSMNIVGQVFTGSEIDIDNRDIVGAFGQDGQCHGFAHVSYSTLTGESNLYLTAYDNQASGRDLYFKLWQYATGRELQLTANGGATLTFQNNTVVGTDTPVRFEGGDLYVQTFDLKEGWNWVSFNVASERLFNLNNLLDGLPWKDGDVLTDMNSDVTLVYTAGHWLASENPRNIILSPRKAYAIKVQEDIKFPIAGSIIKADDERTIDLKQGWNGIGYTPMLNLPIETALSDYYDKAEPGDVVKSHNEFAYFTISGGVGRWRGSLEYMKPGEGYMLLRKGTTDASFRYPFYEPGSTFIDSGSYSAMRNAAPARARATMSVSAIAEGFELEDGDRLIAYANGEECGSTIVNSQSSIVNYLSIAGDGQAPIWFAIERDGEIIAATSEQMTFTPNAVIGSPDEPTTISFVQADREDGKWYSVNGFQLPRRPTQSGVYIFNGKKVVVK